MKKEPIIMKMITVIVDNSDADSICYALTDAGFSFTKMATTGGFLRSGNTTLLIGVEDEKMEAAIDVIRSKSYRHKEMASIGYGVNPAMPGSYPVDITVGGSTLFVTDVVRFEKF